VTPEIFDLLLLLGGFILAVFYRRRGKLQMTMRERIGASAFAMCVVTLGLAIQVLGAGRPIAEAFISDGPGFDSTAYAGFRFQLLGYLVLICVAVSRRRSIRGHDERAL
jgi:hypothetical protein